MQVRQDSLELRGGQVLPVDICVFSPGRGKGVDLQLRIYNDMMIGLYVSGRSIRNSDHLQYYQIHPSDHSLLELAHFRFAETA